MLIAGEKYACEACVRGHRVSNCQHADRQLQHIAKKGRPVSQCTHCRTLRKSRSAHVKCDCGEKPHTKASCTHTKEGDSKDTCCCTHGGRCACALKKDHLDPVPESDSDECTSLTHPIARPRAHTSQSESSGLTVFTKGHHKPAHKHNQMAHKCGLPYVVPRAHSIHGPSPSSLTNRSVDNLPLTNSIDALHSESHIKDSMVSAQQQQRMVKSEHNSPTISSPSNPDQVNGLLPPLDLSNIDNFDYNFPLTYDAFGALPEVEHPIFSAGLSATSIDWSHYDGLDFNNDNFATSEFSQAPSFNGFEFCSVDQPALTTTSTSGEISEVEDFGPFNHDTFQTRANLVTRQYGSDFDTSDMGDEGYRLSTTSSYLGMPQAQMLASTDVGSLNIDEFLKGVAGNNYASLNSSSHALPTTSYESAPSFEASSFRLPADEDDTLWMNDFSANPLLVGSSGDSEAQKHNIWVQ